LKHQNLDRALKSLKHLLEVGAVPNSNLPQLFAKKRAEKMRSQSQAFIEYENMWDFVTSNLPADYEKAKEEAVRLNEQAEKDRDDARARLDEVKQKQIEERKAKELSKQAVKQEKPDDKNDEKKAQKDKKVEVKRVDKDGWVSREVRTLKSDGSVEVTDEPEPAPEVEQKKGKKAKKQQANQQQENKGNQKNQKPAASSSSKPVFKPAEEASKEFLDTNPYAAALREGSFQSVSETQFKRNMEKAGEKPKPNKQKQTQQKDPKGKSPAQSKPKPAEAQSAQQKKQKQPQQVKAQKEAKKAMKVKPVVASQSEWVVPAVVGAGVVIAIAVA